MDTIYLVAIGTYIADVFEGFATNEAEIRQIVANHYKGYPYIDTDKLNIDIDLEAGEVTVREEWDTTYYIHAIQRVEG